MQENKEAGSERRGRFFAFAPLIFWTALIIVLGSGPGSAAETSRFIKPLIEFLFPGAPPDTFLFIHAIIRKTAHFVEYGVLALVAARACPAVGNASVKRHWFFFSLLAVAAVAVVDETNQSYYNSRTSSPWDVALDISGGLFALVILTLFKVLRRRR